MSFRIVDNIDGETYHEAGSLAGFGIYHGAPWHAFLLRVFAWKVKALLVRGPGGGLVWFLPFVTKLRPGLRRVHVALPLAHRLGPAVAPGMEGPPAGIADYLRGELRDLEIHDRVVGAGFHSRSDSTTTILDLRPFAAPSDLMEGLDYKSVRYPINRARREGIEVVVAETDRHYRALYELVVETRHRQGAPVYPPGFFTSMRDAYRDSDQMEALIAYQGERPLAMVVFLFAGATALYAYSASVNDPRAKRLGATDFVMWHAIQSAFARGCMQVDFGLNPNTLPGLRAFKEKWGGSTEPLWRTRLRPEGKGAGLARDSAAVRAGTALFRRLPRTLFRRLTPPFFRLVV